LEDGARAGQSFKPNSDPPPPQSTEAPRPHLAGAHLFKAKALEVVACLGAFLWLVLGHGQKRTKNIFLRDKFIRTWPIIFKENFVFPSSSLLRSKKGDDVMACVTQNYFLDV
jgi:hypothetical protein